MTRGAPAWRWLRALLVLAPTQQAAAAQAQPVPSCVFVSADAGVVSERERAALAREMDATLVTIADDACATLVIAHERAGAATYRLELREGTRAQATRLELDGLTRELRSRALALAAAGLRDLLEAPPATVAGARDKDGAPAAPDEARAERVPVRADPPGPTRAAERRAPAKGDARPARDDRAASWRIGLAAGARWLADAELGLPTLEARGGWARDGLGIELALQGATTGAEHGLGDVSLYLFGLRAAPLLRVVGGPGASLWLGPQLTFHGAYVVASAAPQGEGHDALEPMLTAALRLTSRVPLATSVDLDLALELGATPAYVEVTAADERLLRLGGPWLGVTVGVAIDPAGGGGVGPRTLSRLAGPKRAERSW